ncbi:phage baseplate assembly protein V [Ornithinimicrobium tianjinense]|uniref:Gp5/Type VI secretion system Vgr protein OB-fold domain-containing protein n=1 Tax=Ornithinimicrobium tianjinense TaxID=1195761 RepID=A0A917BFD9_9MICO|nr:phage baseplate assembly protein V [Ornithinimicrobium tianjinense]GGF40650.1 hypothetical protein GCM10011366_05380 [Ornithinimicrobium tianjinense]
MAPPQRGLLRATVNDTADPTDQGRVRVSYTVGQGTYQAWAPVCSPLGATGGAPLPDVDEVVFLGFEDGDPDRPVVLGRVATPATPDQQLQITHAGHRITIAEEGITLELADGSASLTLRRDGVTLRSAGPMDVSAAAPLDLRSAATVSVTGALVRIN